MAEDSLQLAFRDYNVVVDVSGASPLYSVMSKDGALLDANLDEQQLFDRYPSLYDQVKAASADAQTRVLAARDADPDADPMPLAIATDVGADPIPLAITTEIGADPIPLAITTFSTPH
jgi:hypothetical protein